MKIEIEQRELKNALGVLGRVMPTKTVLPILECVHVYVRKEAVLLTACDSDMCRLEIECSATANEEGCFCVRADVLGRALAQISGQMLTLEIVRQGDAGPEVLHVQHKDGDFSMPTEDASAYPELKEDAYDAVIMLPKGEVLTHTMWAASGEELRPQMTTVCVSPHGDDTDFVASDGHVLVRSTVKGIKVERMMLISRKAAGLIAALTTVGSPIQWNKTRLFAQLGNARLWAQLVEGPYPNIERVIPQEHKMEVVVPRAAAIAALRQVLPFGAEQSRASTLVKLTFGKGVLTIEAEDTNFQRRACSRVATEPTPTPSQKEGSFVIGANGQRMVEVLSNIPGERVRVLLNSNDRPMVFLPEEQPEEGDILMLQMPMILNN